MKKDKNILNLIKRLKLINSFASIEVVDYWESDLCAIGIKKENQMVYVSTFNSSKRKNKIYDFDLELIDKNNVENIEILKQGRGVSESELIDEIRSFLKL